MKCFASASLRSWHVVAIALFLSIAHAPGMPAQELKPTAADSAAIVRTALDYIEGFYTGDTTRMARALHPELAKRIIYPPREPGGKQTFNHMTAQELINNTRGMAARPVPSDKQQKDVTILDIYQNAASIKIVANTWIDYLQVARIDGNWKIINVLWELKPRGPSR